MFTCEFTAEDWFQRYVGTADNKTPMPRRVIDRTDFPDAPQDVIGRAVLIPYGALTSVASDTNPPVLTGDPARGAYVDDDGQWVCGFGNLTSLAATPTNVTATAASGGTLSIDVPNAEYGVWVVALDSNGDPSDPTPFYTDVEGSGRGSWSATVPHDSVTGTQRLDVTWSASAGAASYRVYLGYYYYGARWTQYLETASTSCSFTRNPPSNVIPTTSNITAGASVAAFSQFWWYAVSAVMPDGETVLSRECFGIARGLSRPIRIQWLEVPGALSYRIYKRGPVSTYLWRFETVTDLFFDDDLSNSGATSIEGPPVPTGLLPCWPVGTRTDLNGASWYAFLVAGCAVSRIDRIYQGEDRVPDGLFGSTFAVPGKTGFTALFGDVYVDINGRRYTLLYARGAAGEAAASGQSPISCTLDGIESAGDGTGMLLELLPDIYRHWLRNFVLRNYDSGAWATSGPTWGDTPVDVDLVDDVSFSLVKSIWDDRYPGIGLPGAVILGLGESGSSEITDIPTWVARFNQSCDVYSGFSRRSQFGIVSLNEAVDLTTVPTYSATIGINEGSFEVEDKVEQIENQITVQYALNAVQAAANPGVDAWTSTVVEDTVAQAALDDEVKPYTLTLWAIRRADIATEIATRRLIRRKYPYRLVRWESDMGALMTDLGDVVLITHPDGPDASGWTERPVFILRHEFDADRFVIRLESLDVGDIFDALTAT